MVPRTASSTTNRRAMPDSTPRGRRCQIAGRMPACGTTQFILMLCSEQVPSDGSTAWFGIRCRGEAGRDCGIGDDGMAESLQPWANRQSTTAFGSSRLTAPPISNPKS